VTLVVFVGPDIVFTPGVNIAVFNSTNLPAIAPCAATLFSLAGIPTKIEYVGEYAKQFFGENDVNVFPGEKPIPNQEIDRCKHDALGRLGS